MEELKNDTDLITDFSFVRKWFKTREISFLHQVFLSQANFVGLRSELQQVCAKRDENWTHPF